MKRSAIGWTDFSGGDLNFVTGCTPVSESCANCYARRIYERFGRDHSVVETHPAKLERLAKMPLPQDGNKRGPHSKPMAFVCDTGDMFHEAVPDEFIFRALQMMVQRTDVTWQVLTKRASRMHTLLFVWAALGQINLLDHPHVWIGVTAEKQMWADERIRYLLSTPVASRFVSIEPMLGPVALGDWLVPCRVSCGEDELGLCSGVPTCSDYRTNVIEWVICGGESGPNHRPMQREWAQALRDQCKEAGVAFFGKQSAGLRPGAPLVFPECGEVKEWPNGI